ncbi:hypothetical protein I4U23_018370 [Adineta vaga]|nr:hypothetical protein I4U23_018370 [Adineta vaga]
MLFCGFLSDPEAGTSVLGEDFQDNSIPHGNEDTSRTTTTTSFLTSDFAVQKVIEGELNQGIKLGTKAHYVTQAHPYAKNLVICPGCGKAINIKN